MRKLTAISLFVVGFTSGFFVPHAAASVGANHMKPLQLAHETALMHFPPLATTTTTTASTTTTVVYHHVVSAPVQQAPQAVSSSGEQAFLNCVVQAESGGDPTAQNPTSSASGLFGDLDSTWGGYGGYSRAMYAPPAVQWQMNEALYAEAGTSPWAGDGCA